MSVDSSNISKKLSVASSSEVKQIVAKVLEIDLQNIENNSDATTGFVGFLNKMGRKKRLRRYKHAVLHGYYNKKIVSDGDSWFQYPLFIKDIIDWLVKEEQFAVLSFGAGGDWLSNMIENDEFTKAIADEKPDIFLISGGGNDLLSYRRLSKFIHPFNSEFEDEPMKYLNEKFYDYLDIIEFLYNRLFAKITSKFPELQIYTQGYDYAIPSKKLGVGFFKSLTNLVFHNGKWLKEPLVERGIVNEQTQKAIIHILIDKFNELQKRVALNFENVHHVDLRNFCTEKDWYNELHPTSQAYKRMAQEYINQINN